MDIAGAKILGDIELTAIKRDEHDNAAIIDNEQVNEYIRDLLLARGDPNAHTMEDTVVQASALANINESVQWPHSMTPVVAARMLDTGMISLTPGSDVVPPGDIIASYAGREAVVHGCTAQSLKVIGVKMNSRYGGVSYVPREDEEVIDLIDSLIPSTPEIFESLASDLSNEEVDFNMRELFGVNTADLSAREDLKWFMSQYVSGASTSERLRPRSDAVTLTLPHPVLSRHARDKFILSVKDIVSGIPSWKDDTCVDIDKKNSLRECVKAYACTSLKRAATSIEKRAVHDGSYRGLYKQVPLPNGVMASGRLDIIASKELEKASDERFGMSAVDDTGPTPNQEVLIPSMLLIKRITIMVASRLGFEISHVNVRFIIDRVSKEFIATQSSFETNVGVLQEKLVNGGKLDSHANIIAHDSTLSSMVTGNLSMVVAIASSYCMLHMLMQSSATGRISVSKLDNKHASLFSVSDPMSRTPPSCLTYCVAVVSSITRFDHIAIVPYGKDVLTRAISSLCETSGMMTNIKFDKIRYLKDVVTPPLFTGSVRGPRLSRVAAYRGHPSDPHTRELEMIDLYMDGEHGWGSSHLFEEESTEVVDAGEGCDYDPFDSMTKRLSCDDTCVIRIGRWLAPLAGALVFSRPLPKWAKETLSGLDSSVVSMVESMRNRKLTSEYMVPKIDYAMPYDKAKSMICKFLKSMSKEPEYLELLEGLMKYYPSSDEPDDLEDSWFSLGHNAYESTDQADDENVYHDEDGYDEDGYDVIGEPND